jgi:hypothetical protein
MRFRLRFTIRDLFLVTAVVALALGWWLDRHSINSWRSEPDDTWVDIDGHGRKVINQKTGEYFILFEDETIGVDFSGKIKKKQITAINPFGDPDAAPMPSSTRATRSKTKPDFYEQPSEAATPPIIPPADLPPAAN